MYEASLPTITECLNAPAPPPRLDLEPNTSSCSSAQPQNQPLNHPQHQQHPSPQPQSNRLSLPSQDGQRKAAPHSPSIAQSQMQSQHHTPHSPPTSRLRAASTDRFLDRLKPSVAGNIFFILTLPVHFNLIAVYFNIIAMVHYTFAFSI